VELREEDSEDSIVNFTMVPKKVKANMFTGGGLSSSSSSGPDDDVKM